MQGRWYNAYAYKSFWTSSMSCRDDHLVTSGGIAVVVPVGPTDVSAGAEVRKRCSLALSFCNEGLLAPALHACDIGRQP
jgi:hypothetical protein